MRALIVWFMLFLLPLLTGCGNANGNKPFVPYPKSSTSASTANPVQVGNQAPNQFASCYSPTVYTADAGFQAAFQGAKLCPGVQPGTTTRSNLVRLAVGSGVPANTSLCLVPFVYDGAAQEICLPVNGQVDVQLTTNQYTSIVVVPQASLNQYKGYLMTPGAIPPSRILFSL